MSVFLDDLLSLPAFLLFHLTWLVHSIRRPLLLVTAVCILSNPPAALRKLRLSYLAVLYLLLCRDKKWKVDEEDPASFFPAELGGTRAPAGGAPEPVYRAKTVILIRHGESTWNDTFNAGDRSKVAFLLLFLPNLLRAVVAEAYYFVAGKESESWFFDSPLSAKGVHQAEGLRRFLKKERQRLGSAPQSNGTTPREDVAVGLLLALGEEGAPRSHVVSSNLRRAISTAAIGLADRFASTAASAGGGDGIILLPSLQEISINPDALSILPPRAAAQPTWCDAAIPGLAPGAFSALVDARHHAGNKPVRATGRQRLHQFCADVFDDAKLPKDAVVAAGHSLFYRSVFKMFLPRGTEHVAKKKKLVNGGTVMVTLREATLEGGERKYMIDPRSIVVVYGGFGKHNKG